MEEEKVIRKTRKEILIDALFLVCERVLPYTITMTSLFSGRERYGMGLTKFLERESITGFVEVAESSIGIVNRVRKEIIAPLTGREYKAIGITVDDFYVVKDVTMKRLAGRAGLVGGVFHGRAFILIQEAMLNSYSKEHYKAWWLKHFVHEVGHIEGAARELAWRDHLVEGINVYHTDYLPTTLTNPPWTEEELLFKADEHYHRYGKVVRGMIVKLNTQGLEGNKIMAEIWLDGNIDRLISLYKKTFGKKSWDNVIRAMLGKEDLV